MQVFSQFLITVCLTLSFLNETIPRLIHSKPAIQFSRGHRPLDIRVLTCTSISPRTQYRTQYLQDKQPLYKRQISRNLAHNKPLVLREKYSVRNQKNNRNMFVKVKWYLVVLNTYGQSDKIKKIENKFSMSLAIFEITTSQSFT